MFKQSWFPMKGKNIRTKSHKSYVFITAFHQETASFIRLPCFVINHNMLPRFVTQVLKGRPLCGTVMKYTDTNVCIEIMFKDLLPTYNVMYCRADGKDAINVNRKRDL
jgi:hypothetical protein